MKAEIEEFLAEKLAEGRAKSTIYEYRYYLRGFAAFCNDKPLADVVNADIVGWINHERQRDLAPASILARWRTTKIWLRWCVDAGLLTKTPLRMKAPKLPKEKAKAADHDHIQKLLALPCGDWVDLRNRALVHLLHDTGVRVGEALSLKRSDIDLAARLAYIPAGKDNQARTVPFTTACALALTAYLDARPDTLDWLFVGSYKGGHNGPPKVNGRFTVVGTRLMLHRICKAAGIDYINPHSIRHLFATRVLNAGMRVEVVSKILGHSKVDITLKVYASLLSSTMIKEYRSTWGE